MAMVRATRLGLLALAASYALSGSAAAQIRISHLPEARVVEVWQDKGQLFLKGEDGRLFSIPLDRLRPEDLEGLTVEQINRGLTKTSRDVPSVAEVLELLQAGVSENTIRTFVQGKRGRYDLSTSDLLALKHAGASESLMQFLIRAGGRKRFLPGYNGPPRDRSRDIVAQQPVYADPTPAGIPIYPYVFPGYGYGGGYSFGSLHGFNRHHGGKFHHRPRVKHHRGRSFHHFGRRALPRVPRATPHRSMSSHRGSGRVSRSSMGGRPSHSTPRAINSSRPFSSRGLMGGTRRPR